MCRLGFVVLVVVLCMQSAAGDSADSPDDASTDDLDTKTRQQLIDEVRNLRQDVSGARNEISTLTSQMREGKTDTDTALDAVTEANENQQQEIDNLKAEGGTLETTLGNVKKILKSNHMQVEVTSFVGQCTDSTGNLIKMYPKDSQRIALVAADGWNERTIEHNKHEDTCLRLCKKKDNAVGCEYYKGSGGRCYYFTREVTGGDGNAGKGKCWKFTTLIH